MGEVERGSKSRGGGLLPALKVLLLVRKLLPGSLGHPEALAGLGHIDEVWESASWCPTLALRALPLPVTSDSSCQNFFLSTRSLPDMIRHIWSISSLFRVSLIVSSLASPHLASRFFAPGYCRL